MILVSIGHDTNIIKYLMSINSEVFPRIFLQMNLNLESNTDRMQCSSFMNETREIAC